MRSTPCVVVGVVPANVERVVAEAAIFAQAFRAELVFAAVDERRYVVDENPDGSIESAPIDPDAGDEPTGFDAELRQRIEDGLGATAAPWRTVQLAGEPADALSRLAETTDARLIIVGTRNPGFRGTVREFLSGSVATHLAHRQRRPILVVPLSPSAAGLPWQGTE